jgi:hypothetical protein
VYSTLYYWRIVAWDNHGKSSAGPLWHFTTGNADSSPPDIEINYAGDLSDKGGPHWSPTYGTGESLFLWDANENWYDGYYTNNSKQHEDWIYVNVTATDTDGSVTHVWLNWINKSGSTLHYTNYTYEFTKKGGYYEYNTSTHIKTNELYNYSFDVCVNSTGGSAVKHWNKTGIGGSWTRRYVYLNCTQESIAYTPYYIYKITYPAGSQNKMDRLEHDQGGDGTTHDTGYFQKDLPTDTIDLIWCSGYFGIWFNERICNPPVNLSNYYIHIWGNNEDLTDIPYVGQAKYRHEFTADIDDSVPYDADDKRSSVYWNNGIAEVNNNYYLFTNLHTITSPLTMTDNDIYEFIYIFNSADAPHQYPSTISNRSFMSFILFNVPSNTTLNASYSDSDTDGLSDWYELYRSYTNPFVSDTDGDGISDWVEDMSGSDPNNYTDTLSHWVNRAPSFNNPSPSNSSTGIKRYHATNITVSDLDGNATTVCFWNNHTGSWVKAQQNNSVTANTTVRDVNTSWCTAYSTKYWWKVTAYDGHENASAVYSFTTSMSSNQPPNIPSAPSPTNGSIGISIAADLSWTGGDPDAGDLVLYDVYFGTSSNPLHVAYNQSSLSYDPVTLVYSTLYYWRIVAWDNHGKSSAGPLWHFTTSIADTSPPTVHVLKPNGGETWRIGSHKYIRWVATDNVGVTTIDLYYSINGGATYPYTIATGEANDGIYLWTIPNTPSSTCKVKVVAHDAAGNTGHDESNANFHIY